MHQLTNNKKTGNMEIMEVPIPSLSSRSVLVRNTYSVISTGTEGKTVKDARLGYIGKAMARQDDVKKVIESVKNQGFPQTYTMVMNKLDAPSALGYCCAGEVIDIGREANGFKVGDHVVCGGADACHAEVVAVPMNLCAVIPKGVADECAAFATIGSIALQGIRRAELSLGENCVVIGLGLIGQLTMQMLNAAGILSIGVDIDVRQVKLALDCGFPLAFERNAGDIESIVMNHSNGHGADAVIITAGADSLDPVELAGAVCRKRGKVVIVGAVPTGFSRQNYFKKELDLRMSTSYGPGRYDAQYEEKGIDYPIGYVRWTENRNMMSYLRLLAEGRLDIEKLITHRFDFAKAPDAYRMILEKNEHHVGILLQYDVEKPLNKSVNLVSNRKYRAERPDVGFIGAGSFAQNHLLPVVTKHANMIGVATAHGNTGINIAEKYGFRFATGDSGKIHANEEINTIFIATRHDLHAENVIKALEKGKNVFVEKPLALTIGELMKVKKAYESSASDDHTKLMVGFNRRFSPHVRQIMKHFPKNEPKAIHYRINAPRLPADHWVQDPDVGGGRIVGEVCHFIDLAFFIAGAGITSVYACDMYDGQGFSDTLNITLKFENGSTAVISYFSNGNKQLPKERLEVFCLGKTAVIDDFKKLTMYDGSMKKSKVTRQDKGHKEEVIRFLDSIQQGGPPPIPFDESFLSSLTTFAVLDSIRRKTITSPETVYTRYKTGENERS